VGGKRKGIQYDCFPTPRWERRLKTVSRRGGSRAICFGEKEGKRERGIKGKGGKVSRRFGAAESLRKQSSVKIRHIKRGFKRGGSGKEFSGEREKRRLSGAGDAKRDNYTERIRT